MIDVKRLVSIIIVVILIVAAMVAGVFALIKHKNDQIPEQVPAIKPSETEADTSGGANEETTLGDTESETGNTSETVEKSETDFDTVEKSEGLRYSLNDDGNSYAITGIGSCMEKDIVIPATYKGMPVSAIGDGAFAGVSIETVTFSNSVTSIGSKVFVGCNDLEIFFYGTKKEWINVSKAEDWKEQCTVRVWPTVTEEDNWEIPIG